MCVCINWFYAKYIKQFFKEEMIDYSLWFMKIMTCGPRALLYSVKPVSRLYLRDLDLVHGLKQLVTSVREHLRNLRGHFFVATVIRGILVGGTRDALRSVF